MSIKIPIYEQQQSVGGFGPSVRADAPRIDSSVEEAMSGIGKGMDYLSDSAAMYQHQQEKLLKQQQEEDGKAYAGKALSDAHVQWQENIMQRQLQAKPGAPNFTPEVIKDFDDWSKTALEQAPTDAAKKYLGQHLISYRTQLAQHAMTFESQARIGWRTDEFTKAVDNWAVAVAKDPSKYDLALSALNETMPAVGPLQQEKLRDYMRKSLVQGSVTGMIQSDPESAYNLLTTSTLPQDAAQARDKTGTITPPSGARGIRNNNPGNLIKSNIAWNGKVEGQDPRFETFDSPEAGISALAKNLLTYQAKYGRDTVASIVSAWAPSNENDTGAYIANVSKALGVKPDDKLDVSNPATLRKLTRAIIKQENGGIPYQDATVQAGIDAATGKAGLPKKEPILLASAGGQGIIPAQPDTGTTATQTGNPVIDDMTLPERMHYLQQADQEVRRRQQIARADLELKERDQNAQALAGKPVSSPLQLGDFVRAYGQADGIRRFGEYSDNQQFGANVQQVATMTPDEQNALLRRNTPVPDTPGFAVIQHRQELLNQAINQANSARAKDPLGYAAAYNLITLNQIDFSNKDAAAKELASRSITAAQVAQRWGVQPSALTAAESSGIVSMLKQTDPRSATVILGTLASGISNPQVYKATMQQVAQDNPVLANAGIMAMRGLESKRDRSVAELIVRGNSLINQDRKEDGKPYNGKLMPMPPDKDLMTQFSQYAGEAYAGKDAAFNATFQTAKAIYAAKSSEDGDQSGNINGTRWDSAMELATGKVDTHNGRKIVMPYGMAYGDFKDGLKQRSVALITSKQIEPIWTPEKLRNLPLENAGDGRYFFRVGDGYLAGKDGRPVVVDFNR